MWQNWGIKRENIPWATSEISPRDMHAQQRLLTQWQITAPGGFLTQVELHSNRGESLSAFADIATGQYAPHNLDNPVLWRTATGTRVVYPGEFRRRPAIMVSSLSSPLFSPRRNRSVIQMTDGRLHAFRPYSDDSSQGRVVRKVPTDHRLYGIYGLAHNFDTA